MPAETLRLRYSSRVRPNRRRDNPLKRIIIFLVVLIGMAVAIAVHSGKAPTGYIAAAFIQAP